MSPTRRHFLYGSLGLAAAGAVGVGRASRAAAPSGRRLVMVYLDGAWDPTYHIDPKLDTPFVDGPEALPSDAVADETVETIHGHRLAINRTTRAPVAEFFERWGREVVSLSGVTIGGIAHNPNRTRVLTGTPDRRRPDLVTWLGSQESVTEPLGALDLSGWGLQGARGADATRAGAGWQLHTLLAGNEGLGAHLGHDPVADDLVEDFLRRRAARLPPGPRADYGRSLERSVGRLEGMRDHAEPLAAILGRSPRLPENHALVAADLVARGFARSVLIDPGFHFDTHANNAIQERLTHDLYAMLDVLMTALTEQGALDHMLVVVCSEMTRSPRLNRGRGKDHWPLASYLFMGGGVSGGRQLGGTDHLQAPLPADVGTGESRSSGEPLDYTQVHAGLAAHLGLDPAENLPGVTPFAGLSGR